MADTTSEETPTQRAARLRREKRAQKFAETGADRLASITSASGREQDLQPQSHPKPSLDSSDPPEVDISNLPPSFAARQNASPPGNSQEDPFLSLMQQAQQGGGMPGLGGGGGGPDANDPIMKMMQQMFSPPPGTGGAPIPGAAGMPGGPPDGLPPGLAAMLGGAAAPGPGNPNPQAPSTSGYIWRIVHAIFSLLLASYVAFVLPFDGSKSERDSPLAEPKSVFWIFATVELGLQSARYMLEKGGTDGLPAGWMRTVVQFLPSPYGNYVKLALRYSGYWTTLVEDAMGVVFVLGAVAWWKGLVET